MISRLCTEALVALAAGFGIAWVCIWLHEHGIRPADAIRKHARDMSIVGLCALALWSAPLIQYGSSKTDGGTNNVQNVANVEMLPMANTNSQWSVDPKIGNWQHWNWQQFHIGNILQGNIGTGNNSTLATLITSTNTSRTLEAEDFERGFVMSRVGTGEAFDFSAPAGATVCSDWRAFGAATEANVKCKV